MTDIKINDSYGAPLKIQQFQYDPQPDITVYELALILPVFTIVFHGGNITSRRCTIHKRNLRTFLAY